MYQENNRGGQEKEVRTSRCWNGYGVENATGAGQQAGSQVVGSSRATEDGKEAVDSAGSSLMICYGCWLGSEED